MTEALVEYTNLLEIYKREHYLWDYRQCSNYMCGYGHHASNARDVVRFAKHKADIAYAMSGTPGVDWVTWRKVACATKFIFEYCSFPSSHDGRPVPGLYHGGTHCRNQEALKACWEIAFKARIDEPPLAELVTLIKSVCSAQPSVYAPEETAALKGDWITTKMMPHAIPLVHYVPESLRNNYMLAVSGWPDYVKWAEQFAGLASQEYQPAGEQPVTNRSP